jgi:DNA-binding MarR family transcriptional regulator
MAFSLPPPHDLAALYGRPGFLLRRAHQIAMSIFLEETARCGVTTTSQYGVMTVLRARPGIDQIGLARLIGLDRSTTGLVIGKLEAAGLVARSPSSDDRRRKELTLTALGHDQLERLGPAAEVAERRVLEPFTPAEAKDFLRLITLFVDYHNADVRIPMDGRSREETDT